MGPIPASPSRQSPLGSWEPAEGQIPHPSCSCPTSPPTSWHRWDLSKPPSKGEKPVRGPFRTRSQHGSTQDASSRLTWGSASSPPAETRQHRGYRDPAATPSHQTLLKAGFIPEILLPAPPSTVLGFVWFRLPPGWLIKGFNGPWSGGWVGRAAATAGMSRGRTGLVPRSSEPNANCSRRNCPGVLVFVRG